MAFNLTENQYVDQVEYLVEEAYSHPRRIGLHAMASERGEDPGPRRTILSTRTSASLTGSFQAIRSFDLAMNCETSWKFSSA